MIARPHDGLAGSLRGATARPHVLVSRLSGHAFTVRSAGWRHAQRWPLCSRSAWRRSREHTRAHEYDDCSTARRPRRPCGGLATCAAV
eukprot:509337-Prymnesium_polylepis.1